MKCLIGLGSNLGDRRVHLEQAATCLRNISGSRYIRLAPVLETPALLPPDGPDSWKISFLNTVAEIDWPSTPESLLGALKKIESDLGRGSGPKWAPRIIDLDLLTFGDRIVREENLRVPHPEIARRQFVLGALKHLRPSMVVPGFHESVLRLSRRLENPVPLWMGVLNLTPDSFSDGNVLSDPETLSSRIRLFDEQNVQILDLGAESTRPGATPLSPAEEWSRLAPGLEIVSDHFKGRLIRPWISVDTFHPETAARAIASGVDIINDVSGLNSPEMMNVLSGSSCQYVLMHSLSVPADPAVVLKGEDPITEIRMWAERQFERFSLAGVNLDRVVFDPGVGFGKTGEQSMMLVHRAGEFLDVPVRVLFGHSRKSFLTRFGARSASDREAETLGVSLRLAERGIDILRVHAPDIHQRAFRAFREI